MPLVKEVLRHQDVQTKKQSMRDHENFLTELAQVGLTVNNVCVCPILCSVFKQGYFSAKFLMVSLTSFIIQPWLLVPFHLSLTYLIHEGILGTVTLSLFFSNRWFLRSLSTKKTYSCLFYLLYITVWFHLLSKDFWNFCINSAVGQFGNEAVSCFLFCAFIFEVCPLKIQSASCCKEHPLSMFQDPIFSFYFLPAFHIISHPQWVVQLENFHGLG